MQIFFKMKLLFPPVLIDFLGYVKHADVLAPASHAHTFWLKAPTELENLEDRTGSGTLFIPSFWRLRPGNWGPKRSA